MKYTAHIALILFTCLFAELAQAKEPKTRPSTTPTSQETHRGGGRRESKVSGKDFCDEKCGGTDSEPPHGTGGR